MTPHMTTPSSRTRLLGTDKATTRQRGAGKPGPSPKPLGTVPPPRNDVMRAPVYVPPSCDSARAGADDHYQFKSKGF